MKKMKNKLSLDAFKIARLSENMFTIWGGRITHNEQEPADPFTGGNTTGPKTNSSLCCNSNSCPPPPQSD